jgi:hypothetical protein
MADEQTIPDTHEEITIDRAIRTADHNVYFPGKAVVNKRQVPGIEAALAEEANRTRSMMIEGDEEEDDGGGKLLGDTRSSASKSRAKKAASKKRGG